MKSRPLRVEYAAMASNPPHPLAASGLFIHCRPGFEADCAAELAQRAAAADFHGYPRASAADAFLTYHLAEPADAGRLLAELGFSALVFARDVLALHAIVDDLPEGDRAGPMSPRCTTRRVCIPVSPSSTRTPTTAKPYRGLSADSGVPWNRHSKRQASGSRPAGRHPPCT